MFGGRTNEVGEQERKPVPCTRKAQRVAVLHPKPCRRNQETSQISKAPRSEKIGPRVELVVAFLAVLPMEPLPLLPGSAFHDEFSPWWEPHTRGVSGQAHVVWSPGPAGGCYPFASNTALYWGLSHIEPFPGSDGGTVSHARWLRGPPSAQSQNCHDPVAPAGQLGGGGQGSMVEKPCSKHAPNLGE